MKNVTITMDEETARWARVEAARHDTSVSRLVGGLVREHMLQQLGYEKAMADFLSRPARALKRGKKRYPSRSEVHERA